MQFRNVGRRILKHKNYERVRRVANLHIYLMDWKKTNIHFIDIFSVFIFMSVGFFYNILTDLITSFKLQNLSNDVPKLQFFYPLFDDTRRYIVKGPVGIVILSEK